MDLDDLAIVMVFNTAEQRYTNFWHQCPVPHHCWWNGNQTINDDICYCTLSFFFLMSLTNSLYGKFFSFGSRCHITNSSLVTKWQKMTHLLFAIIVFVMFVNTYSIYGSCFVVMFVTNSNSSFSVSFYQSSHAAANSMATR